MLFSVYANRCNRCFCTSQCSYARLCNGATITITHCWPFSGLLIICLFVVYNQQRVLESCTAQQVCTMYGAAGWTRSQERLCLNRCRQLHILQLIYVRTIDFRPYRSLLFVEVLLSRFHKLILVCSIQHSECAQHIQKAASLVHKGFTAHCLRYLNSYVSAVVRNSPTGQPPS
jgi:hypothetical protein